MTRYPDRPDTDPIAQLAACRPTDRSFDAEWSGDRAAAVLATIIGDEAASGNTSTTDFALRFVPVDRRGRPGRVLRSLPVAASVAAVILTAGILIAVVGRGNGSGGVGRGAGAGSAGPSFDPPAGLSHTALRPSQFSHRVDQQIDLGADGRPTVGGQDPMVDRNWISPSGDILSIRTGSQNSCNRFLHTTAPSLTDPTMAFFAALPTDVDALTRYVRGHVEGSSSHDEAVFVAVGDALRTADGLASPALRAAFVGVLSRTPGATVHQEAGLQDYLGRAAIRADFVDQRIRPDEMHSLYFDPTTFQLLEERFGSTGRPSTYAGPSPAYDAAATDGPTQLQELTGPGYVDVMVSEDVVDRLPTLPADCPHG